MAGIFNNFDTCTGFCTAVGGLSRFPNRITAGSNPVLSAQKPWFFQGFSHFWPIALAFLPIHACPCLQVLRRLVRCLGPW